jgi:methyl-accepting chemotaxis protein
VVQSAGPDRFFLIGLAIPFLVLTVLLFQGKLKLCSILTGGLIALSLSALVFVRPFDTYLEMYMLGAFMLFTLGVSIFTGYYPWQVFLVMGIWSAAIVLEVVFRMYPNAHANGTVLQWDDAVINLALGWIMAAMGYSIQKRNRRLVQEAQAESVQNVEHFKVLQSALEAAQNSLDLGSSLSDSAQATARLSAEAQGRVAQAGAAIASFTEGNRELALELEGITESSKQAREGAETQASVVNETSSAVEQMTASIKNISGITQQRKSAVEALSRSTEHGREVIEKSATSMEGVQNSASSILGIVKVINSVAAQTNLLAMNAAIEAAHAGDYGRGFSVVADEIRKLSEQTGKNVKAVAETVKGTLAEISRAADNNSKAIEAFSAVESETKLVSAAMDEIIRGLTELAQGTEEINRGVAESVSSTTTLREAVAAVDTRIENAMKALSRLNSAAALVRDELTDIGSHVGSIGIEAKKVEDIGQANKSGLDSLSNALGSQGMGL